MEVSLAESIYGFASEQTNAQPSEPIFVLTSSQLQDLLSDTIQPLQDRVESLEATVTNLEGEVSAMKATELQDFKSLSRENRDLFEWVGDIDGKIGHKEPGKTELSRAEKIEKYLLARPDHKASFETLKGHLGTDKARLNEAIRTLMKSFPGRYGIARTPGDKRKKILVMLPK